MDKKVEELKKEKDRLLAEQESLIHLLKTKNAPVYNWFVQRGIDFSNLEKFAASFAAAATLLFSNSSPTTHASTPIVAIEKQRTPQARKSDLERGQFVWNTYGSEIRSTAAKYNLDPNLIFATIMIESGGNPRAIRHEPRLNDASYGLGQLLYSTAKGLGYQGTPEGLYEPAINIDLIGRYHKRNLDHFGHLTPQQLTTAYNTGSPYKKALAGHLNKFNKWFNRIEYLEVDLT